MQIWKRVLCMFLTLLMTCSISGLSEIIKVQAEERTSFSENTNYVARINTSYYNTLEEAVAAATDNDTIFILRNYDLNKCIDTRGLTLTLESEPEGDIFTIKRGTEFKKFDNGFYEYDLLFHINGGHLTINNLMIDGGAIWNEYGNNIGVVSNSVLIYLYYGSLTLNEVILQNNDNDANTPSDSYAGAIGVGEDNDLVMNGGTIRNNRTGGGGGAIQSSGGRISINNTNIINNKAGVGGAFYLWEGSLQLKNCVISKNTLKDGGGGAIYSMGSDIIIENSKLSDNMATLNGGAIFLNSGSLKISDSELNGNTANMNGGAIAAFGIETDSRAFQIKDSKISGNYSGKDGGGIYYDYPNKLELSGDISITPNHVGNIYLEDRNYPISLTNQLIGTDRIGITVNDSSYTVGDIVVDGSNLSEGAKIENFYYDGDYYCLEKSGKNLILGLTQTEYAARIETSYYTTLDSAVAASVNGDTIYLLKNITQNSTVTIGKQISLKSEHGGLYQIKRGSSLITESLFIIATNGDITIRDIRLDGGAKWDEDGSSGYLNTGVKADASLVTVNGKLIMESGSVIANNDIYHTGLPYGQGSGVSVTDTGTFIMHGGEITENAIGGYYGYGAGVHNSGIFELRGGRITKNTLHVSKYAYGGGVCNGGTLSIYEGEISENIGSANGGGIFSVESFTMYGGKISNNISTTILSDDYGGGGVQIYGSGNIFTMEDGEISGNVVTNNCGGGVCAYYGSFTMKGGIIKDNIAKESGGGVRVHYDSSTFTMTGGIICGNYAKNNGGGIYLTGGTQFNLANGKITDNKATSGGGIYNSSSNIDYKYAAVKDNQAGTGGGITVNNGILKLAKIVDISGNKKGDVYLYTKGKAVILKENITALKPIGILVSSSYTKGDIVVNGNSNSIHGSLEDFYYTGSEYKLVKNGFDIILETSYHVTYDGNGSTKGSTPIDINDYQSGDRVTIKDLNGTLEKTGNHFSGWNTNSNGTGITYTVGDTFTITNDTILYALWTRDNIETFPVVYDANGANTGSVPVNHTYYRDGTKVNVFNNIGNLSKSGYVWNGWNTKANGSGTAYQGGSQFIIHEITTLHAQWKAVDYTLTYDSNGAEVGSVPITRTYKYEEKAYIEDNIGILRKSNYKYSGWNTKPDGSGITYTVGDELPIYGNITLYALWTNENIPTFTISYNDNQADHGTVPINYTHYLSGTQVNVFGNTGNLRRTDYFYVGWNTRADSLGISYIEGDKFTISEDVVLYADWQLIQTEENYAITYNGNGSDKGIVPVDNTEYNKNDIVTVLGNIGSLEKTSYSFKGWNTQADGQGITYEENNQFLISESITLYAIWEIVLLPTNYYTIRYHANMGTVDRVNDIIESGYKVNLPNAVREGYIFLGWYTQQESRDTVGTVGDLYEPLNNIDLYARWQPESIPIEYFIVTYDANGGTANQTIAKVASGSSIILTGAEKGEYTFLGWYTDKEDVTSKVGEKGKSYTPIDNITLYALWELNTEEDVYYTITYNANGGTVSPLSVTVASGSSIVLTKAVREGYSFLGWYDDENNLIGKDGETYQPFIDITLVAKWDKQPSGEGKTEENKQNESKPNDNDKDEKSQDGDLSMDKPDNSKSEDIVPKDKDSEDKKPNDKDQNPKVTEEPTNDKKPILEDDGDKGLEEDDSNIIITVDDDIVQTGYQDKQPFYICTLIIGIGMLSVTTLYCFRKRKIKS